MSEINVTAKWLFRMWAHQVPSLMALSGGCRRIAKVWHRRSGKDLCEVNRCASEAQKVIGIYYHMFPELAQGRKILWDGMDNEGKRFLDYIPKELINGKPNETEMQVEFNNGSIYQIIGADRLSWIGTNPRGVVLSEYQRQDPRAWDYMRPILRANKGWAVFCYTPLGHNHGYKLYEMARQNPAWFCEKLTVLQTFKPDGTRIVTDEDLAAERAEGMDEALIQQEYFCSFEGAMQGSYYGDLLREAKEQNRVTLFHHDPSQPVVTAWDIGVGDACAIGWFQRVGRDHRMIDYHEESDKGIDHFARVLQRKALENKYTYELVDGKVLCLTPHDSTHREKSTAKRIDAFAREHGLYFRIVPKVGIQHGIQAVRKLFPRFWFHEKKCARMLDALASYQKIWDDLKQCFADSPFHNWASHPCDMLRYYAVGVREDTTYQPATKAIANFNPLSEETTDMAEYEFNPFAEVR